MNSDIELEPVVYHWYALGADGMVVLDFVFGRAGLKALTEKPDSARGAHPRDPSAAAPGRRR